MARKKSADEEAAESTTEGTEKVKLKLRGKKEGGSESAVAEDSGNVREASDRPLEHVQMRAPAPNGGARESGSREGGTGRKMEISEFKNKSMNELVEMALSVGVENPADLKKPALIFSILQKQSDNSGQVYAEGVLEVMPDGYGFLRSASYNYLAGPDDIYVSPAQIRMFALRKGDTVYGQIRMPRDNERFFAIMRVDTINGVPSGEAMRRVHFDNLTPLYPEKQIKLETTAE